MSDGISKTLEEIKPVIDIAVAEAGIQLGDSMNYVKESVVANDSLKIDAKISEQDIEAKEPEIVQAAPSVQVSEAAVGMDSPEIE